MGAACLAGREAGGRASGNQLKLGLRNARLEDGGPLLDIAIEGERVARVESAGSLKGQEPVADLAGALVMPALVNGHDHLDFSTFPPLGHPPYPSLYDWAADVEAGRDDARVRAALAVPLADRLFLGGLRNLLCGVAAVAHHNPYHRSMARPEFPVRVLARYQFAHSPGLTQDLRKTYRSTDRRLPWMVHAAEGTDERSRREVRSLAEKNLVRQNTVIIHAIALGEEDATLLARQNACVVWCPESNRRLYGATAPVAALRAAGVRVGLGSDSPVSGVRDPLSNLAAARHEAVLPDRELLAMATTGMAEVVRLPAGGGRAGAPADLVAIGSPERLLKGDRGTIKLVIVDGRPRYGEPELMAPLVPRSGRCRVDGHERRLAERLAGRTAALVRAHPALRELEWMGGLEFD